MEAWKLAAAFAGSFAAGYLGSVVGLVLGTLRLPLFVLLAGGTAPAAGTNIAISAATAASGATAHVRAGRISWRVALWMIPPSVAGAVAGALLGHHVPEAALEGAIAAVLVWNGLDLLVRPVRGVERPRPLIAPAVASGFGIGVLGGALGVILGTLRMPALLRAVGLPATKAVGTNLVVGAALGAAAFAARAARLEVDWWLLAFGLAGGLPGAWLGARATGRFSEVALRRAIGAALLVVGAAFAVQAVV
jgi:uncharacterized membrane protein YfcA